MMAPFQKFVQALKANGIQYSGDSKGTIRFACTTSAGGAKAVSKTDWASLAGTTVIVLPDNDSAGDAYAANAVAAIRQQASGADVRICLLKDDWPEIPEKGDSADWVQQFPNEPHDVLRARLEGLPNRLPEFNVPEAKSASEGKPVAGSVNFEIIDSRTFSQTVFSTTFLIDGIMTAGQPELYGGPSKTLKTSVMVDQCLSLAAAVPFLGRFNVPKAKRCLLLSSESGTATLQETARRISRSCRPTQDARRF